MLYLVKQHIILPINSIASKTPIHFSMPEELKQIQTIVQNIDYLSQEKNEYKALVKQKNQEIKQATQNAQLIVEYLMQEGELAEEDLEQAILGIESDVITQTTHVKHAFDVTKDLKHVLALSAKLYRKQSRIVQEPEGTLELHACVHYLVGQYIKPAANISTHIDIPEDTTFDTNMHAFEEMLSYTLLLALETVSDQPSTMNITLHKNTLEVSWENQ